MNRKRTRKLLGVPECQLDKCHLGFLKTQDVVNMSVLSVTNTQVFEPLGAPAVGGLYDRRMGTVDRSANCQTCGQNDLQCMGHMGHIELPCPLYHPMYFYDLLKLLRVICRRCYKLMVSSESATLFINQMKLIFAGDLTKFNNFTQDASLLINRTEEFAACVETYMADFDDNVLKKPFIMSKGLVDIKFATCKKFFDSLAAQSKSCYHCREKSLVVYKNEKSLKISSHLRRDSGAHCKSHLPEGENENMDSAVAIDDPMNPSTAFEIVKIAWKVNPTLLGFMYGNPHSREPPGPEMFFIKNVVVFPPKFRPFSVSNNRKTEHPQTVTYGKVLRARDVLMVFVKMAALEGEDEEGPEKKGCLSEADQKILEYCRGETLDEKFENAWVELQRCVNNLMDSSKALVYDNVVGVKQMIEKKQGIFRNNLMGKRVNYGARSVITPDPMIATNEVGVPFEIATNVTYPEPITKINMQNLKHLIRNGPCVYPGAQFILDTKSGQVTMLDPNSREKREHVINTLFMKPLTPNRPKFLLRHIRDGDIVLLNRQPTLHRPSIQGHLVRVLRKERTIRLHYSACKAYNADFDGDEINMHFPQSYNARSEGYQLMNGANNYLSPKDGAPLGGLIQDHIVGAVHLTMRSRFFTKEQYQQLVLMALPFYQGPFKSLKPTIMKPTPLWTGKQVFSTVMMYCLPQGKPLPNFVGKCKVAKKLWCYKKIENNTLYDAADLDDSILVVSNGELLQGVIDKASIGSADLCLTHCLYELYGPQVCSSFLSACSKLLTYFLQNFRGFTAGAKDVQCTRDAERARRKNNKSLLKMGIQTTAESLLASGSFDGLEESELETKARNQLEYIHKQRDEHKMSFWEKSMNSTVGRLNSTLTQACIPFGMKAKFPENNFLMMIESGAKGSGVNMAQIAAQNGQIELEGRRIALQLSGKHLPCYKPYDLNPVSGGYAHNRFLRGLAPPLYVYHCMAGRDGLVDTVVKTSTSGYLQRCLIKLLEGVKVHYDRTVRDCDSSLVQFLFGEDGLDPNKTSFLKNAKTLTTIAQNRKVYEDEIAKYREFVDITSVKSYAKELEIFNRNKSQLDNTFLREGKEYKTSKLPSKNPTIAAFSPSNYFGSVSERFEKIRNEAVSKEAQATKQTRLMNFKYMQSLMEPGEGIGLITSQSIGEPSTQMTLNTFHFAGRGEVNVTLGIPRMKELLQTASKNIKTPTMTVPLLDKPGVKQKAEKLAGELTRLYLKDVVLSVEVDESYSNSHNYCTQLFKLKFNFVSRSYLKKATNNIIKPSTILRYMESVFMTYLGKKYQKYINNFGKKGTVSLGADDIIVEENKIESGEGKRSRKFSDADSDVEVNDEMGMSANKNMSKVNDEQDYDDKLDVDDEHVESDVELENENNDEENLDENGEKEDDDNDDTVNNNGSTETSSASLVHEVSKETHDKRVTIFLKESPEFIIAYEFDTVKERSCTVTYQFPVTQTPIMFSEFVKEEVSKTVFSAKAKDVSRAFVTEGKFVTEGVNLEFMCRYSNLFDLSCLYTNSIHQLRNQFGIEAAYVGIIKELNTVFESYGITVDRRHLSLIADFMTQDGSIKAFDRQQIASNPSHFQRMSFESAFRFLKNATLSGCPDDLVSPSTCVAIGKASYIGTGCFDLIEKKNSTNKFSKRKSLLNNLE